VPVPDEEGFMDPEKMATLFGIREGMKIADFGCGSGFFTILMAKITGESGHVSAIDVMESPLETVKQRAKESDLRNISTIRADLEVPDSTKLSPASQDLVLMANVLFQSNKRKEIIKEAARVLKTSGGLVVIGWQKGVGGFGPPEEKRDDPETMSKLVEENGFKKVDTIDAGAFHYGLIFRKI
jgi:ubiquinone/menaquinone biosynthesis C-methylase UbiE